MFLYFDFLCSFVESIFVYNIFTFPQSNLQTIPANDDFSFLNKVHLYYSLCQSQKKRNPQTCNTSIDTIDWEKT